MDGGQFCVASKVIYEISKLRYKNNGDPQSFKAFLRLKNIPPQMFARYVGNRLHVMFHMGGVVIHYLNDFCDYLKHHCKKDSSRRYILSNLEKPAVLSQLQALGLVGKLVTGPWMKLLYKNEAEFSNLQCADFFKTAESMMSSWPLNPLLMLTAEKDVFAQPLSLDPILESLREASHEGLKLALDAIIPSLLAVIQKQLEPYLTGALSNPSPDLIDRTASSTPHNIWAERVVGMTCQLWKRCPMAKISFLDAKIKAKTNHTMDWLDSKDVLTQDKMVSYARKRARMLRKERKGIEKSIDEEIVGRMQDTAHARNETDRKKMEKQLKAAAADRSLSINSTLFDDVDGFQRSCIENVI